MFSFFKKSKRSSDKSGCENKVKFDGAPSETSSEKNGSAPDDTSAKLTTSECDENSSSAAGAQTEQFFECSDNMNHGFNGIKLNQSYAGALKTPETRSCSVKPCGHGTVAISPRVAKISGVKRENGSPPMTIKFDAKKFKERKNSGLDESAEVKGNKESSKLTDVKSTKVEVQVSDEGAAEKNLINQEAKFQSELNDLTKQLTLRDAEANKLRYQVEDLQRDVFAKSAGMDRLQAELQAANKESDIARQRILHLERDLATFRENNSRLAETLQFKTEEFEQNENAFKDKITELHKIIDQYKTTISSLENQLESIKMEKERAEKDLAKCKMERSEDQQISKMELEHAILERIQVEQKWKEDFEKMRTVNILKEQNLLDDFEWKLREVQQTCKKRLEEKEKQTKIQLEEYSKLAESKIKEMEELSIRIGQLEKYEAEIARLKFTTEEQRHTLQHLKDKEQEKKQIESSLKEEAKKLRKFVEMEKENIQHMERRHRQEIIDKERKLQQVLNEKRTEIAAYWEDKLLQEIGRLKYELEQIYSEEQYDAIKKVQDEKQDEINKMKKEWEKQVKGYAKEIELLKKSLEEKDRYYHEEMERKQTQTDMDILELRRLMDKIDMSHHERFEKLVIDHENELENINRETEKRIMEVEFSWQQQVTALKKELEFVKESMEQESQEKIATLIEKHRSELDDQWANLILQKQEAINLMETEYVDKYKSLEEQFQLQQKSHENREIDLLKTIDSLKNELESKNSTVEDLQNNVDTLEGGVSILNQEIAQQSDNIMRMRREADVKIRNLQATIDTLNQQQQEERESFKAKLHETQKESQETIEHLQKKCTCLTKLFEEVRMRYERRESRPEDINAISDLRQIVAEQEKDLACINEEKRYFQMRLLALEKSMEENHSNESFRDDSCSDKNGQGSSSGMPPAYPLFANSLNGPVSISIPPTIQECDDYEEC